MTNPTKTKPDADTPANFDSIVDDLAALRRDIAALTSQMTSGAHKGANGAAASVLDRLGGQANHLYDSVVYDSVAGRGDRATKAVARQIEEQPLMSLLIAFGVGIAASRLLSR